MSKGARNKGLSPREQAQQMSKSGSSGSSPKKPIFAAVIIIAIIVIVVAVILGLQKQKSGVDLDTINEPSAVTGVSLIVGADRKIVNETKEKEGVSNITI